MNRFVVFDFETTGLDAKTSKVTEIGVARFIDGKVVSQFSTFIKLDEQLTPRVKELTGITDEDLKTGLEEKFAFRVLWEFLGDDVVVCHNAGFDMAFLEAAFQKHFGKSFKNKFIDTLTIGRDRKTYPHTLGDMCEKYDIWVDEKHRAINDVWLAGKLLIAMDQEEDVTPWINKLGYMKKYGPPKWHPEHAELVESVVKYEPK